MASFFYLVALPLVVVAVAWALLFLPSKSTGWLLRLDVGLAWFAALATLILVPADVSAALGRQAPGQLAVWWRAAYWYGFAAQVLLLPLHMEFARSGEFTIKARLAAAARTNLLYYFVLLAVGLGGLLLLLAAGRLQPSNVVGFCIASSNAYGLVAAIFLLGFGLVAVPRQLWYTADPHGEQRRLCHKAGLLAERALSAHRSLSAAVLTARRASALFAAHDPLRPLMDAVLAQANSVGPAFSPDPGVRLPEEPELDVFDRSDLARLRREVKSALRDWEREQAIFAETVTEHLRLEAVVRRIDAGVPSGAPLPERAAWLWECHLHFWAYRLLAALAALCSLAIIAAEATIAGALPNLSVVSAALHATAGSPFATELLCFLFLAYPCACAYYSVYRLGRFAFYRMVPRHTDAYSLGYSALIMCRFAAPLAFNFMAAIAMPEAKGQAHVPDVTATVFYAQFGSLMMRQPLIGWQFTTFAPALLVPFTLLIASGVFGHVVALFKRGEALEFEDDWAADGHAANGRRLLRLESENARSGLPVGLSIEGPLGGGAAGGAAGPGDGFPAAASSGLLGALRGAAAAAADEEAAERRRRGSTAWLARLLPRGGHGRGSDGGSDDEEGGGTAGTARSRLSRLLLPQLSHPQEPASAGYSQLPGSESGRPPRPQGGARGGGGVSGGGGEPFGASPPARPGAMKAARAAYLARGRGAGGSGSGLAGAGDGGADVAHSGEGRQGMPAKRGSVDVESAAPGGG